MKDRYMAPDMSLWKGRVDSDENYDAFRWHQWMKPLDLSSPDPNTLKTLKTESTVAVALLGFACDEGVRRNLGRVGAAKGPQSIKTELRNLPCSFTQALKLYDAGTILCDDGDLEKSQEALAMAVSKIISLNIFPIVLGGGHEVAYGSYKGLIKKDLYPGIVNFDAHFDIRPYPNRGSSGTMFRQIYDDLNDIGKHFQYFAVGIQKRGNTVDLFKTMHHMGGDYLMAKDIGEGDLAPSLQKLSTFTQNQEHIYVTICTDVFSSAFAPGVSATQPLGLQPERILKYFKAIFKTGKVVLFDIAEVSPRFDNDNITSSLAATFVFSAINSLASIHHIAL